MVARRFLLASLCVAGFCLGGAAPPRLEVVPWEPSGPVLLAGAEALSIPVEPGEQYPPTPQEDAVRPAVAAPPAAAPSPRRGTDWRLAVDMSVTGDSNVTNGTDLRTVPIDTGGGPLPVPVDPNLREKAGIGVGVSAAANMRLPIAAEAAVAVDVEAYALEYEGPRSDDASILLAAGVEFGDGGAPDGSLQLIAFDRWYGGVKALEGVGLRGSWRHPVGPGSNLRLAVDARIFDSGYGDDFSGSQASVYLTYDSVLNPNLSASGGIYVRREWLGGDAFSSLDSGAYGGLSAFLGRDLAGGASAGLSRTVFDEPFLLLGQDPRKDWRPYASAWLSTRRPLSWGLHPSLTYTYSRTSSSIPYFSSDRHRVRLGVQRKF
ncbi:MAG TPA: surface lipoprotein assembly modifier [Allosphingosinicella sp.]|nr:surface lipoprotein assembly modifier [Allosphingosinicella sp.]